MRSRTDGVNTLTDCTISGNTASIGGGGVNLYGTQYADRLAPSEHWAAFSQFGYGGGAVLFGPMSTLTDCTIQGNSAGADGGGVAIYGPATLNGCTISGNSAGAGGGGFDTGDLLGSFVGSATLTNCTISGNSAGGNGGGLDNSYGGSTTLNKCTTRATPPSPAAGF